jgi:hypothetical protein
MGCRQEQAGEERAHDQMVADVFLGRSETANKEEKEAAKCLVVSETDGCWQSRHGLIYPPYIPTTQSDQKLALLCSMALYYVPSETHTHTHTKGAKWSAGVEVEMPFNRVPHELIIVSEHARITDENIRLRLRLRLRYSYPDESQPLPVSSQHIHSTYLFRWFSLLCSSKASQRVGLSN